MKIAAMSDIHANPVALEKVLAEIDAAGVDQIVCCGDVVGYGPDPRGAIDILRSRRIPTVMGNHDAAVAGLTDAETMNPFARMGVERHRACLGPEDLAWLANLPYVHEGRDFACAHGDFWSPESFTYLTTDWESGRSFRVRDERFLFVGHVHVSLLFTAEPGRGFRMSAGRSFRAGAFSRHLFNVGSVGYPRAEPHSTWVMCDTVSGQVAYHRVAFDFEDYRRRLLAVGVEPPGWLD